jgi:hypothetical protein
MTSKTFFQEFKERSKEVSDYFLFVKDLEEDNIQLVVEEDAEKPKIKERYPKLSNTLKASAYLLLYNLVESSMRNAIEAIFAELKDQEIPFDNLTPKLKKIVIENIKDIALKKRQNEDDTVLEQIKNISLDIIWVGFNKEKALPGNLDGKSIKNTAEKYGFSYQTNPQETNNGRDLENIKNNRNDLAHGVKSFAEVGQGTTADELIEIKNKTINYLRQILQNIETYLVNREYLDSSTGSP